MSDIEAFLAARRAREREDEQRLNAQPALTAPDITPDDAATHRRLVDESGLSPAQALVVPSIARAAEANRLNALRTTSPRLHQWASQPENFAIARDDVDSLSWWERTFGRAEQQTPRPRGGFVNPVEAFGRAIVSAPGAAIRGGYAYGEHIARQGEYASQEIDLGSLGYRERGAKGDIQADYILGFAGSRADPADRAPLTEAERARLQTLQQQDRPFPEFYDVPGNLARFLPQMGHQFAFAGRRVASGRYSFGDPFAGDTYRGGASGSDDVIGRFVQGYNAAVYQQEAGQHYVQDRALGYDEHASAVRAGQYAAVATPIEFLGDAVATITGGTGKAILSVAERMGMRVAERQTLREGTGQILRTAVREVAAQSLTEGAEEGTQQWAQIIFQDLARQDTENKGAGADIEEALRASLTPESIDQILQAAMIGAQAGLSFGIVPGSINVTLELNAAKRAATFATRAEEAIQNAQSSKTQQRHGPTFEAAVNASTTDPATGQPGQVHIDADKWAEHFGSDAFKAAQEMGVSHEALAQALQSHGMISMPLGAFANRVLANPKHTALYEHTRADPAAQTVAEARADMAILEKQVSEYAQAVFGRATESDEVFRATVTHFRGEIERARKEGGMAPPMAEALFGGYLETFVQTVRDEQAAGVLTKEQADAQVETAKRFVNAIRIEGPDAGAASSDGSVAFARSGPPKRNESFSPPDGVKLNARERQVAQMAINGAGNEYIAEKLGKNATAEDVAAMLEEIGAKLESKPWEPAIPNPAARELGTTASGAVLPISPSQPIKNSLRGGSNDLAEAAQWGKKGSFDAFHTPDTPNSFAALNRISDEDLLAWYRDNVTEGMNRDGARTLSFRSHDGLARPNVQIILEPGDAYTATIAYRGRISRDHAMTRLDVKNALHIFTRSMAVLRAWMLKTRPEMVKFTGATPTHDKFYRTALRVMRMSGYENREAEVFAASANKSTPEMSRPRNLRSEATGNFSVFALIRDDIAATLPGAGIMPVETTGVTWAREPGTLQKRQTRVSILRSDRIEVDENTATGRSAGGTDAGGRRTGQAGDGNSGTGGTGGPTDAFHQGDPLSGDGAAAGYTQANFNAFSEGKFGDGLVAFSNGEFGDVLIRMGKAASMATMLHEFGHVGHLMLEAIAMSENAPQRYKDMWSETLSWWGITQEKWDSFKTATVDQAKPGEIARLKAQYRRLYKADLAEHQIETYYRASLKTPYIERWAETFEDYLLLGKPPSLRLRPAFAMFKALLKKWVYPLFGPAGANLTPQIRDVFDRLLATDKEIAEARAHQGADFVLPQLPNETPEAYAERVQAHTDAREVFEAAIAKQAMAAVTRAGKREYRAQREANRNKAQRWVDSNPAQRVLEWLGFREWRALPDTESPGEGEIGYTAPDNAMETMPEDLPTMAIDGEVLADQWPDIALPFAVDPRAGVDQIMAEASRLKRSGKDKQAARMWSTIQKMGGIKIDTLPEADQARILEAMGGPRKRPGLINNKTGASPEQAMNRLAAEGYFGEAPMRYFLNKEQAQALAAERGLPDDEAQSLWGAPNPVYEARPGPTEAFHNAPIWGSAVARTAETLRVGKGEPKLTDAMPGADWWNAISRAPGVKKDELNWLGLEDYLKASEAALSREEVVSFIRANGVQVEETLRGGENPDNAEIQRQLLPLIEERDRLARERDQLRGQYRPAGFIAEEMTGDIALTPEVLAAFDAQPAIIRRNAIDARVRELRDEIDNLENSRTANANQTKWSQFQIPGGTGYKELLLRLPDKEWTATDERLAALKRELESPNLTVERRVALFTEHASLLDMSNPARYGFRSSHFPEPNILVHVRFNERTDVNGKRTLFLEEVQSDWHQAGRKRGYKDAQTRAASERADHNLREAVDELDAAVEAGRAVLATHRSESFNEGSVRAVMDRLQEWRSTDPAAEQAWQRIAETNTRNVEVARQAREVRNDSAVPDAPFKNNAWAALAMKRMIRYAAENGFEQIAWIPGHVKNGTAIPDGRATALELSAKGDVLYVNDPSGRIAYSLVDRNPSGDQRTLTSVVGKDVATRLLAQEESVSRVDGRPRVRRIEGDFVLHNVQGWEFYDHLIPSIANDLGKKYGARVGATQIETPRVDEDTPFEVKDRDGNVVASYYDENAALEHAKRIGGTYDFPPTPQITVHSLPLTPAMREGVLGAPMDAFARADNGKAPDLAEFIDTLVADLRGDRQVYSVKDEGALKNAQDLTDARAWFEDNGIDLSASKEDIRAAVIAVLDARKDETAPTYHPDEIAQWFGFSSGDEMLKAIAALKPRAVAIEQRMDEITQEELGDPMNDGTMQKEAQEAAHEETQARKIEIELAALEVASGGRKSALARHAKIWAQEQIEAASVRDIRHYDLFLAGERRAAKQAFDAAADGDMQAAALAKARQLMSFWLYHYARKADAHLTKMQDKWQRYSASTTTRAAIGSRNIEQIDAILDSIETGKPSFKPKRTLSQWAEDVQADGVLPEDIIFNPDVIAATVKQRLSDMSYGDVMVIDGVLKNIEKIGRGAINRRKAMDAANIADLREGLKERLRQEWSKALGKVRSLVAPNNIDTIKRDAASFHAVQLKADFIARHLDGFKDGGPFLELLGADVQHADNDRHVRTQAATKQFMDIVRAHYTPKEFERLLSQRNFVPILKDSRTKAQLIGYALNRGTRYNFEALLVGEGWNEPVFWEVVASLDRNDWAFVQDLWKFVGQWKEERFALEERTRGVRPVEQLGEQFQLPNGAIIEGAYWPIAFDPTRSEKAMERQAKSDVIAEHGAHFRQPGTKRGSMIGRVGTGGQALSNDFMAILSSHAQQSINDLAYRETVITLRRTLADKELLGMIKAVVGERSLRALKEWLARLGQDMPPTAFGEAGALLPYLRRSNSNFVMGLKASISILNLLGHFQAMPRNGLMAQLKQASITLGPGFAGLLRRYAVAFVTRTPKETSARVAFVTERSPMVASFLQGAFDREIIDAKDDILGRQRGTIAPRKIAEMFQYFNIYTNQLVVIPAWMAAYDNAINGKVEGIEAGRETKAIDHADNVVRMTVAAGASKDLAAVTASRNEWVRITTQFMNWANIAYNQFFAEQIPGALSGKISFPKFAANMLWIWAAPAVLSMVLRGQLDREPDEDDGEYWTRIMLAIGTFPLATAWLVRDIASNLISGMPRRTPGDTVMQRAKSVVSAAERGDTDRMVKQAVLMGAQVSGIPQAAVTAGDYAVDLAQGKEDPAADPADAFSEALLRDTR